MAKWYEPCERTSHSTAVVGTSLFLWGGEQEGIPRVHDSIEKRAFLAHVNMFQLQSGSWEQQDTKGVPPLGVWGYSCAAMGSDIYYFSGSCGHDNCRHNSIHKLSTPSLQWSELAATASHRNGPMKKSYSGMVAFKDGEEELLFTVGGLGNGPLSCQPGAKYEQVSDNIVTNEQHIFSMNTHRWSSPAVIGNPPPPYANFSLTLMGESRAGLFGGDGGQESSNTLFIIELGRQCVYWHKLSKPVDQSIQWPGERSGHAAGGISRQVLVVLGGGNFITLGECWISNSSTTRIWRKLSLPESVTKRGYQSVSVFHLGPHCVWLLVFGGRIPQKIVAYTAIIELVQGGDGQWSVGKVLEGSTLTNRRKYQSRLAEARKERKDMPPEEATTCTDRSVFEQHLWQQVQQLHKIKKEADELRHETEQAHQEELGRYQNLTYQLEEGKQQLQLQLTEKQTSLQKCRQDLDAANEKLGNAEQQNQQHRTKIMELEQEKQRLEQQALCETQLVHQFKARSVKLMQEKRELEQQVQQLQKQLATEDKLPHWAVNREELEMTSQLLGTGGWGNVKVAKFRGYRVAAKCLHQRIISRYNMQQFKREMNISAKLRHPNILLFMGATFQGELIILTELLPTSLKKELESTKLTRASVNCISHDVACGLSYLHLWKPSPIIHRDISSGNILLEPLPNDTWRAKISDYGSANFMNSTSTVGPGSPAYSAPEAVYPQQQSPKMDVFSFGVLLIEMCNGELPETNADMREAQIRCIQWQDMVSLVRQCIREKPTDRPSMQSIVSTFSTESSLQSVYMYHAPSACYLQDQNWYHGKLDADEAVRKLQNFGQDGAFLVRDSNSYPGSYSLSVLNKGAVTHMHITLMNGSYSLGNLTEKFNTINDLISCYMRKSIVLIIGNSVLKCGVPRFPKT